jgi:ParB family chromosome partitioning protein
LEFEAMAIKRPALGRGLSALIRDTAPPTPREQPAADRGRPTELDIDLLSPNPRQPRVHLDDARLDELAQSIRANGVIQPIVVRRVQEVSDGVPGSRYEIVAGERRWRASQRAGLLKVPVSVREVPDDKLLEVALIENIQREDLNPIEEAQAYRKLTDELQLSQESIAAQVGKDRATIANYMRLLRLPAEVRTALSEGELTMGHAKALLSLTDEAAQRRVGRDVIARGLSVRETEALVRSETTPKAEKPPAPRVDANTRAAEEKLKLALGTRVRIIRKGRAGRIEVDFTSEQELQRLYEKLTES